jgi:hypothetical protein
MQRLGDTSESVQLYCTRCKHSVAIPISTLKKKKKCRCPCGNILNISAKLNSTTSLDYTSRDSSDDSSVASIVGNYVTTTFSNTQQSTKDDLEAGTLASTTGMQDSLKKGNKENMNAEHEKGGILQHNQALVKIIEDAMEVFKPPPYSAVCFTIVCFCPLFLFNFLYSFFCCKCSNGILSAEQSKKLQFSEWIFAPYITCRRSRLSRIQESIKGLGEEQADYMYIIYLEDLLKLDRFPRHEEALEMGVIHKVAFSELDSCKVARFAVNGGFTSKMTNIHFISHKWGPNNDPDPNHELFQLYKTSFTKALTRPDYHKTLAWNEKQSNNRKLAFWFDYTCVPQLDRNAQKLHLRSISKLLQYVQVDRMDLPRFKDQYKSSIW